MLQRLLVGAWLKDLVNLHLFGRPLSLREVDILRDFKADLTKLKESYNGRGELREVLITRSC